MEFLRPKVSRGSAQAWALLVLASLCWLGRASCLEIVSQEDSLVRRREEYVCPSNCGNKGHCIMGKCYCLFGYAGENCAIVSDVVMLKPGGSYTGHITSKSWRYFTVNIAGSNPGHLKIELLALANVSFHGANEGLELRSQLAMFVNDDRKGLPDESNFKSRCLPKTACSRSNKLELRVDEPQGSTWTVGIRSGGKDEYFAIGVETPLGLCSDSCSGRGVCLRDRCCCKPGSKGSKCEESQSSRSLPIQANSEVPGNVGKDAWRHYFLSQMHSTGTFQVTLKILSFSHGNSVGKKVHLVVNKSEVPLTSASKVADRYEHTCSISKQQISDASSAECVLKIEKPGPFAWFIGILGDGLEANYVLETKAVEHCPHGCSLNGECNAEIGKCFCRNEFTGSDCYKASPDLPIAVGGGGRDGLERGVQAHLPAQGFSLAQNGGMKYHKIVVPKDFSENLEITVENIIHGGVKNTTTEAMSVYLQRGVIPTDQSHLLHEAVSFGTRAVLSLSPPLKSQDQVLWLGVQSRGSSMYTIAAEKSKSLCKHDCNGQGFCYKGVCQCHPGFAGISCGYHLSTAASEKLDEGRYISLVPYQWSALNVRETFEVPDQQPRPSTHFQLAITMEDLTVDGGRVALPSNFSCKDIAVVVYNNRTMERFSDDSPRKEEGSCHLQLPLGREDFHISRIELLWQHNQIESTPARAARATTEMSWVVGKFRIDYDVVVECPNDCSGAGTCKKGVCLCNHDRIGEDCSKIKPQLIPYEQMVTVDTEKRGGVYEEYEGYDHQEARHHQQGEEGDEVADLSDGESDSEDNYEDQVMEVDEDTMYSGYLIVGGIFFLISCLTIYMRYSDRHRTVWTKVMKSPKPPDDDLGDFGSSNYSASMYMRSGKTRSYASLLERVDEEENFPDGGKPGLASPKTPLANMQLPLPNVMKGPQMRQRKTISLGMLSDSTNEFGRGNGYDGYQEIHSPKGHVAIQLPMDASRGGGTKV
ncbi:EGF-like domain-containing protein [Chloropicon primus]|uniref:EGF-like domain-containing protein n=1 Tax=Chloropicon primus TaxID=1764295 RepID=A0A5B8ML36_9CHLO|nr:hypothetical protein A3770_04p32620 [Chloropicon primus]UPQ99956.1 EGF-like domain-containing protein [Chloropicon primus]|eukprot:QDZ20744.1 hypothetical protein A3770_04p32620 [Chloropicon primus]